MLNNPQNRKLAVPDAFSRIVHNKIYQEFSSGIPRWFALHLFFTTVQNRGHKRYLLLLSFSASSSPPQDVTVVSVTYFGVLLKWIPPPNENRNGRILQYSVRTRFTFSSLSIVKFSYNTLSPATYSVPQHRTSLLLFSDFSSPANF